MQISVNPTTNSSQGGSSGWKSSKSSEFYPKRKKIRKLFKILPPKTLIGLGIFVLMLVGGVSAFFLSQSNQDLRQQASGGVYSTCAGGVSAGDYACASWDPKDCKKCGNDGLFDAAPGQCPSNMFCSPDYVDPNVKCAGGYSPGDYACAGYGIDTCKVCGEDGRFAAAPGKCPDNLQCSKAKNAIKASCSNQKDGDTPDGTYACAGYGIDTCKVCNDGRFVSAPGQCPPNLQCGVEPTPTPTSTPAPIPTPTTIPAPTPTGEAYCNDESTDKCIYGCIPTTGGGRCKARPVPDSSNPAPTAQEQEAEIEELQNLFSGYISGANNIEDIRSKCLDWGGGDECNDNSSATAFVFRDNLTSELEEIRGDNIVRRLLDNDDEEWDEERENLSWGEKATLSVFTGLQTVFGDSSSDYVIDFKNTDYSDTSLFEYDRWSSSIELGGKIGASVAVAATGVGAVASLAGGATIVAGGVALSGGAGAVALGTTGLGVAGLSNAVSNVGAICETAKDFEIKPECDQAVIQAQVALGQAIIAPIAVGAAAFSTTGNALLRVGQVSLGGVNTIIATGVANDICEQDPDSSNCKIARANAVFAGATTMTQAFLPALQGRNITIGGRSVERGIDAAMALSGGGLDAQAALNDCILNGGDALACGIAIGQFVTGVSQDAIQIRDANQANNTRALGSGDDGGGGGDGGPGFDILRLAAGVDLLTPRSTDALDSNFRSPDIIDAEFRDVDTRAQSGDSTDDSNLTRLATPEDLAVIRDLEAETIRVADSAEEPSRLAELIDDDAVVRPLDSDSDLETQRARDLAEAVEVARLLDNANDDAVVRPLDSDSDLETQRARDLAEAEEATRILDDANDDIIVESIKNQEPTFTEKIATNLNNLGSSLAGGFRNLFSSGSDNSSTRVNTDVDDGDNARSFSAEEPSRLAEADGDLLGDSLGKAVNESLGREAITEVVRDIGSSVRDSVLVAGNNAWKSIVSGVENIRTGKSDDSTLSRITGDETLVDLGQTRKHDTTSVEDILRVNAERQPETQETIERARVEETVEPENSTTRLQQASERISILFDPLKDLSVEIKVSGQKIIGNIRNELVFTRPFEKVRTSLQELSNTASTAFNSVKNKGINLGQGIIEGVRKTREEKIRNQAQANLSNEIFSIRPTELESFLRGLPVTETIDINGRSYSSTEVLNIINSIRTDNSRLALMGGSSALKGKITDLINIENRQKFKVLSQNAPHTAEAINRYKGKGTIAEELAMSEGYRNINDKNTDGKIINQSWLYSPDGRNEKVRTPVNLSTGKQMEIDYKLHVAASTKDFDPILREMTAYLREIEIKHKTAAGINIVDPRVGAQYGKAITIYSSDPNTMRLITAKAQELAQRYQGIPQTQLTEKHNLRFEKEVPGTNGILYYTAESVYEVGARNQDRMYLGGGEDKAIIDIGNGQSVSGYEGRSEIMDNVWGQGPLDHLWGN